MPGDMMNTDWSYAIVWLVIGACIVWAIFGAGSEK